VKCSDPCSSHATSAEPATAARRRRRAGRWARSRRRAVADRAGPASRYARVLSIS
jgi:hypothetical protein